MPGEGAEPVWVRFPAPEILERVAQRELDLALVVGQRSEDSCTTVRAALIGIAIRQSELRMVENVEHLGAKLELLPFGNFEVLEC